MQLESGKAQEWSQDDGIIFDKYMSESYKLTGTPVQEHNEEYRHIIVGWRIDETSDQGSITQ